MDADRFDHLAVSLAQTGSSRRSLLGRCAGGGLAAMLAALGLGGFSADGVEAKKKTSCVKRCNKKAKKKDWSRKKTKACKVKCNEKAGGGGPTGFRIISTGDVGEACTSSATCDTGFCRILPVVGGTCQLCDPVLVCGNPGNHQCCLVGADCVNGACIG